MIDALILVSVKIVGALFLLAALAWGAFWLAWKCYGEIVGWPKIRKAVREYNQRQR